MAPNRSADRIAHLQQKLGEAKHRKDTAAEIDTLLSIAEEARKGGDPGGAHTNYNRAEEVIQRSGVGRERLHEALGGRGRSMRKQKRHPEALELFQQAEQAARAYSGDVAAARWIVRQAAVHRFRGAMEVAADVLDAAEALLRPSGNPELRLLLDLLESGGSGRLEVLADLEGERGLLALAQNDQVRAEDAYRRALDFAEAAGDQDAINIWATNLGNACSRRRRYDEAEACYQASRAAGRQTGDESSLLNTARNRAATLAQAHRNEEAAEILIEAAQELSWPPAQAKLLEQSLQLLGKAGAWTRLCEVGGELEALAADQGADLQYLQDLRRQIASARRWLDHPLAAVEEGPTVLDVHIPQIMGALAPAKNTDDALAMADVAHLICDAKLGLLAADDKVWRSILTDTSLRHRVVGEALMALCTLDLPEKSLELSQRYKSVGFALPTLRHMAERGVPHPEAAAYLARIEDLREATRLLRRPAQMDYFVTIERVRAAGEALLEAGELLRERDPILQARMGGLVQPDQLIDALPLADPVAIVDLFVTGEGTVGHVIIRDRGNVRVIPFLSPTLTATHAMELVGIWHQLLEIRRQVGVGQRLDGPEAEGLARIAKILHDRLFCHLARHLSRMGITQIILIPDLLTRHLPLHLAGVCEQEIDIPGVDTEGAEHLCEVMPVEYVPCLQAVAVSQVFRRPRQLERLFSIADPRGDLVGARKTGEWLGSQLPESLTYESLTGSDGTLGALKLGLEKADVAILGTHGHFDTERPEESYLVLSDGHWKMASMLEQTALGPRPVIVLSACEVGAVAATTDDRVAVGITGALIASGAASVLASLWPVEDISMGYLIQRFLTHLSHRGYRPAAALFRAVRDLRRLGKEEALVRCRRFLEGLQREGASARQIILLENLIEWIEDRDAPHPFASPVFWGGVVVVGSGWHQPAGAMVGNVEDLQRLEDDMGVLSQAEELIKKGDFDQARRDVEQLLPRLEGIQRARALSALARAAAWGSSTWSQRTAGRRALRLLAEAERLAYAEQDDAFIDYLHKIRATIETPGGQ